MCDQEKLQAYARGELADSERAGMEAHLHSCSACREESRRLREREDLLARALEALDPAPSEVPPAAAALARWRVRMAEESLAGESVTAGNGFRTFLAALLGTGRRPAVLAVAVALLIVASFAVAPARRAMGNILSVFRVRQFSAFSIDKDHSDKLKRLMQSLRAGLPAEAQYDRKPGEPQKVTDASQASTLAGFTVKVPQDLPAGATRTEFTVAKGPAMHFDFDRAKITAELDSAGLGGVALPPMESGTVRVDVPAVAMQAYRIILPSAPDTTHVLIIEAASPAITLPPGADLQVWGESMFEVLGMPPAQARHMAQSIDWTSTLVVPLPTDAAAFKEVQVNGATGLLVEQSHRGRSHNQRSMLVWTQGDVVYSVQGERILSSSLLDLAQSLR